MNINRKYIIIFGILILFLVIVIGAITYCKEKAEQAQISDKEQSILSFSQDYPANLKEVLNFISFCNNGVFSEVEELKDKKIKQIACMLIKMKKQEEVSSNLYFPFFMPLEDILFFKTDKYLGISVDLKDVVREYDPSLLKEDKLYFCSISEPSWADPFSSQMKPKQTLIFDEGDVSCFGVIKDPTLTKDFYMYLYFYGFVPQTESLNIKQYLVEEQTVSNVMSKQSFSEIKEILKDYPIIWQMEKPIIP